jgi:hypothetical protein
MGDHLHRAPNRRHALPTARVTRLALLTLAACFVLLGWSTQAGAVTFATKPFSDNRPGTSMRDVIVRGSDNHVWLNTFNETNWNGWLDLGGDVRGRPTAVSFGRNHLDIFARDSTNHLIHRYWDGTSFSSWQSIGGAWQFVGDPIPVSWANGRIDVFARGTDNALLHAYSANAGWSSWESLGGSLGYDPAAISHHSGHLDVYAVAPGSGLLSHRYYDGGWSTWQGLGGFQFTSAPSAAASPQEMMVVARGTDGAPGGNFWNSTGWLGNFSLGGYTPGQPEVVTWGDPIYIVFVRTPQGLLNQRWTDAQQWYPWAATSGSWVMTSDPSAIAWGGSKQDVFATGTDGSVIHTWFDGSAWHTWENLGHPQYPTSLNYGGGDASVNTDQEARAVSDAENLSGDGGAALWAGLSPTDQGLYPMLNPSYSAAAELDANDDLTGGSSGGFGPSANSSVHEPGYLSLSAIGCSLYHNGLSYANPFWAGDLTIFGCSGQVKILHVGWDFNRADGSVIKHYNNNDIGVVHKVKTNAFFDGLRYQEDLRKIHKGTSVNGPVQSLKICVEVVPWGYAGAQKARTCNSISRLPTA